MAVRSMEMAEMAMETDGDGSGALPRPGRVPEHRLLSPEICLRRRRSCGTVLGKTSIDLGFGRWKSLNRRRGGVRGPPGGPHHPWTRPGGGHAPSWRAFPLAPLRLLFGLRSTSGKNRGSGTCFVQFREYFLCSISKTKKTAKNRELALWHLVSRLVPKIA
jgi:hypothetical protein